LSPHLQAFHAAGAGNIEAELDEQQIEELGCVRGSAAEPPEREPRAGVAKRRRRYRGLADAGGA